MTRRGQFPAIVLFLAGTLFCAAPRSAWACASCFGASDSSMARGMNFGILTLLIVVLGTMGALATFFIYLARRAAAFARTNPAAPGVAAATQERYYNSPPASLGATTLPRTGPPANPRSNISVNAAL